MFRLAKFSLPRCWGRAWYTVRISTVVDSVLKDDIPPEFVKLLPPSKYGGESFVTLLTGNNSIGRQGAAFISTLIDTAKVPINFERIYVSGDDEDVSQEFIMSVLRNRTAIQVDLSHDPVEKQKSLMLNNNLDLYACITKMESWEGYNCRHPGLKLTVVIQNNTGDYTKLEYEPVPGVVETLRINRSAHDRRYLRFVFEYARSHSHKKITIAHKSHILELSDGRFTEIACELSEDYPEVEVVLMPIDKMVRNIILQPHIFDLICCSDRYGTVITSICSAVCGGASLFSTTEMGDKRAIFKPLQTKLSLADCRTLSPYGIVRACIELLLHLGNTDCATVLQRELTNTMLKCNVKTAEFGGTDSGEFIICNIVNRLKCKFAS